MNQKTVYRQSLSITVLYEMWSLNWRKFDKLIQVWPGAGSIDLSQNS